MAQNGAAMRQGLAEPLRPAVQIVAHQGVGLHGVCLDLELAHIRR
ncbi:MAG: hypothetical protein ACI9VX_000611, partial [Dinoroseobacter sp.]